MPLRGQPPRWRAAGALRTSRRRDPDRPGQQLWLRGPGGCGQRHGEGGRCPRPPRPGGRQDCRREGGHGRRRGGVQGAAGGRAGARRGPARSPVPGRAITCARAGRRRPRGQARRRVARAAEGDAAARAHTVVVAARMAQGRAFARHLPPDRSEPAEQQARLQTPPRRRLAVAPERRHQAAGRERQAVVDPPSVNALGVRGSSRFTAESHPSFPLTHDALSECAVRAGDDAWRQHVDRALEILRHLTRIAGHHRHHAEGSQCLRSRLEQQQ